MGAEATVCHGRDPVTLTLSTNRRRLNAIEPAVCINIPRTAGGPLHSNARGIYYHLSTLCLIQSDPRYKPRKPHKTFRESAASDIAHAGIIANAATAQHARRSEGTKIKNRLVYFIFGFFWIV